MFSGGNQVLRWSLRTQKSKGVEEWSRRITNRTKNEREVSFKRSGKNFEK